MGVEDLLDGEVNKALGISVCEWRNSSEDERIEMVDEKFEGYKEVIEYE